MQGDDLKKIFAKHRTVTPSGYAIALLSFPSSTGRQKQHFPPAKNHSAPTRLNSLSAHQTPGGRAHKPEACSSNETGSVNKESARVSKEGADMNKESGSTNKPGLNANKETWNMNKESAGVTKESASTNKESARTNKPGANPSKETGSLNKERSNVSTTWKSIFIICRCVFEQS